MFTSNSWGKIVDILHRSMSVNRYKDQVIANNLANGDTPNYKRQDVAFESSLRAALATENEPRFQEFLTDERHIPFHRVIDYRTVTPHRVTDYSGTTDNNGNNVDLELEANKQITNTLHYDLMIRAVSDEFSRINLVLRG
jgi:flagellar basal-body rod protein FlgB